MFQDAGKDRAREEESRDGAGRHLSLDRFLANRAPYAMELDRLLGRDEVAGHDSIYGELLIGDTGGRKQLLDGYVAMHRGFRLSFGSSRFRAGLRTVWPRHRVG